MSRFVHYFGYQCRLRIRFTYRLLYVQNHVTVMVLITGPYYFFQLYQTCPAFMALARTGLEVALKSPGRILRLMLCAVKRFPAHGYDWFT